MSASLLDMLRAARLPPWNSDTDNELRCVAMHDETADVRSFTFAALGFSRFAFTPGQFLTFEFDIEGVPVNRCYTIASSPTRPDRISITVKRKEGGLVSPWLHAAMRPGVTVRAVGPLGDFTNVDHPGGRYLFLSGGSGITPMMSMARAHQDLDPGADILFVHFARSPADIIFRDELALMARQMPNLRVVHVCEADNAAERWGGPRGRVSAALLALAAPDLAERTVFDCGPAPFMAAVRAGLDALGFDMRRYHEESFDFATLAAATEEPVPAAVSSSSFSVTFNKSGRTIDVSPAQSVLAAAREAGMRLPSSCTKGICGTCKSRLVSGQVEMKHQGGIRQREIDQGMILLCCSNPLSDLVIER